MDFEVKISAGVGAEPTDPTPRAVTFEMPNPRAEPTVLTTALTGGHPLHLAVATCVLNDIYREAQRMGIPIDSVSVSAGGGFGGDPVVSTGITYSVEVVSPVSRAQVDELIE